MPLPFKPREIPIYLDWIDCIITEAEEKLSSWESSFIADLTMRLEKGINLSEAQANKLETIYTEKT